MKIKTFFLFAFFILGYAANAQTVDYNQAVCNFGDKSQACVSPLAGQTVDKTIICGVVNNFIACAGDSASQGECQVLSVSDGVIYVPANSTSGASAGSSVAISWAVSNNPSNIQAAQNCSQSAVSQIGNSHGDDPCDDPDDPEYYDPSCEPY